MERAEITRLLAEQDWKSIHARLVKVMMNRGASKTLAEDVVGEAVERVFAFDSEWDPEAQPSLLRYLMGVSRMVLYKERQAGKRLVSHDRHAEEDKDEPERQFADPNAFGPERAAAMDLHGRRISLLRARLSQRNDEEAVRALDLALQGVETPAEIAAATSWSLRDAFRARERMQRAALQVAEELPDEDDDEEVA